MSEGDPQRAYRGTTNSFAKELALARLNAGLSREELGRKLAEYGNRVTGKTIENWEKGANVPARRVVPLENALGLEDRQLRRLHPDFEGTPDVGDQPRSEAVDPGPSNGLADSSGGKIWLRAVGTLLAAAFILFFASRVLASDGDGVATPQQVADDQDQTSGRSEVATNECAAQIGYIPAALDAPANLREVFIEVADANGITCAEGPVRSEVTDEGAVLYQEVDAPGTTRRPGALAYSTDGTGIYLDPRTWRIITTSAPGLPIETTRLAAFGPITAVEEYDNGRLYRFTSGHGISHLGRGAGPSIFLHELVMAAWDANGGHQTIGLATGDPHWMDVPNGSFVRQEFTRGYLHASSDLSTVSFVPVAAGSGISSWTAIEGNIISTMGTPNSSWLVVSDREVVWLPTTYAYDACGGAPNRALEGLAGAALAEAAVVGEIRGSGCSPESL